LTTYVTQLAAKNRLWIIHEVMLACHIKNKLNTLLSNWLEESKVNLLIFICIFCKKSAILV